MSNIIKRQNLQSNIDLLAAQDNLYNKSKSYQSIAFIFGVCLIVLFSTIGSFLNNKWLANKFNYDLVDISDWIAIYGLVATAIVYITNIYCNSIKEIAAKIQEEFDTNVYKMRWDSVNVQDRPKHTDIFNNSRDYLVKYGDEKFRNWYRIEVASFIYPKSIIFCQEQNLCWDQRLRYIYLTKVIIVSIILFALNLIFLLISDISLKVFLSSFLGSTLPLLTYCYQLYSEHKETIKKLDALNFSVKDVINRVINNTINDEEIFTLTRDIQTAIYNHRKTARTIPNWLQKKHHDSFERETAHRIQNYINHFNSLQ